MSDKNITNFFDSPIEFEEKPFLRGIGGDYLDNKYFNKWQEYLVTEYVPPKKHRICLFIPCAWGKPYSQSYIHYFINKTLSQTKYYDKIHQIIVSNAGVVPREWENFYPFAAYDWDPTLEWEEIKIDYAKILFLRLKKFIEKHEENYTHFACYLRPDSDNMKAVNKIISDMKIKIPNFCKSSLTRKESEEISINGIYEDCDHILLKTLNLGNLKTGVIDLVTESINKKEFTHHRQTLLTKR